jgi:hypothetical protein
MRAGEMDPRVNGNLTRGFERFKRIEDLFVRKHVRHVELELSRKNRGTNPVIHCTMATL